MTERSLTARIRVKKYRSWKGEVGKIAPNILKRDFKSQKPNEKGVTEVTEFAVGREKRYLLPIIALFNGEIISYTLSERHVMNRVQTPG